MRKLVFAMCLSATCLIGIAHEGILRVPGLHAQDPPLCANAMCSGPSFCVYGRSYSCQFLGPDSCATSRCAFILQH
jgi:hypothetical protein